MMRHEFDTLLKSEHKFTNAQIKAITKEDYDLIEYVYTWHPMISEVDGKHQVAYLYATFGIGIFRDMEATAKESEGLQTRIRHTLNKLKELQENYDMLKKGVKPYANQN